MRFTVCDDEAAQRILLSDLIRQEFPGAEVRECCKAEEAPSFAKNTDILLLDIDTKSGMDGMNAARIINRRNSRQGKLIALPLLIFVTGYPERMQEAFGVHAFYFLVKPIRRKEAQTVLREAAEYVSELKRAEVSGEIHPDDITIRLRNGMERIARSSIVFAESNGRNQLIHTVSGETKAFPGKLKELEELLGSGFFRIHRSFIVNLSFVRRYGNAEAELTDGTVLLLSKYKKKEFAEAYLRFLTGDMDE